MATTKAAASFRDLDGLAITKISSLLDARSAAALAATDRSCRDAIAHEDNVDFWKRVAGEVWGFRGVEDPGTSPRLPGGSGAGEVAGSWKECCVGHSDLLSRYGEDGRRAARAWHRIEAALELVAPRALAALEGGYQVPRHYLQGETMSRELLAAAAIHNGQKVLDPDCLAANLEQWASASLLGSMTCYEQGFLMPMRNLVPAIRNTALAQEVRSSRSCSGDDLVSCAVAWSKREEEEDDGDGSADGDRGDDSDDGKQAATVVRLHLFAAPYIALEGMRVGDLDISALSMANFPPGELPTEGVGALGVDVGSGRVYSVSLIDSAGVPLLPARPADARGKGFLFWLDTLGEAIERGRLGALPRGSPCFPLSGPMRAAGVGPDTAGVAMRRGRRLAPPPHEREEGGGGVRGGAGTGGSLSRYSSAPPGLSSRVSHNAILVSRSAAHTWMARVRTADELRASGGPYPVEQLADVFSYKIRIQLLSVEEQREAHAASAASPATPFRAIRRARLTSRFWVTTNAAGVVVDRVDGTGVIGYTPILVARERRDGGDGGDDFGDSFSYCSRCVAPPLPPRKRRGSDSGSRSSGAIGSRVPPPPVPGQSLGTFGGHLEFVVWHEDEGEEAARVPLRAEVPPIELVVPDIHF